MPTWVSRRAPPESVLRSFAWNRGAYQRCYAQAFARRPGLAGKLVVRALFDREGNVSTAVILKNELSSPDREFEACALAAAREQWMESMGGQTGVLADWPLLLTPAETAAPARPPVLTAGAVAAYADQALARGFGELALRAYAALAQQGGDDPRRCGWYVGALRAALLVAPWVDARVFHAVDELLDHLVAQKDAPDAAACVADARSSLERVFMEPYERAYEPLRGREDPGLLRHYVDLTHQRHRALIAKAPFLSAVLPAPPAEPRR